MKIYDSGFAPNPRRVRVFLAEKGIEVPYEQIDLGSGAHHTDEFRAINPLQRVPVLELDDGTHIAETVAICRYFEGIQPEPSLFGTGAVEMANIEMWNRRAEFELLGPVAGVFRNSSDFFKGRIEQIPEWGVFCEKHVANTMEFLDNVFADSEYLAGDVYSIADITALIGIDFGKLAGLDLPGDHANVTRWYEAVSARPSAAA